MAMQPTRGNLRAATSPTSAHPLVNLGLADKVFVSGFLVWRWQDEAGRKRTWYRRCEWALTHETSNGRGTFVNDVENSRAAPSWGFPAQDCEADYFRTMQVLH